ncbi:IRS1 family protein [Megaselia abdita]
MTSNSNGGMITMMSSTMMPTTLSTTHHQNGDVVLQGYHKKLKTMRRKYFVLLAEDDKSPARLEYYDSEKKFKSSKSTTKPKRVIHLKNCFNINRRLDTKHDYVIALSTREEVFCMVLDDEAEMNKWLKLLLILQRGENIENTRSDTPQPNYEHVWQVQIQRRGLAERNGIVGPYYVCLTSKSLTLIRIRNTNNTNTTNLVGTEVNHTVEFPLSTIRRYGDSACLFYLEVGRKSVLGTGELWMETEDAFIAKNMHKMISSATTNSKTREEQLAPMRIRSSSASEASKPMLLHRRPTISGNKTINSSPLSGGVFITAITTRDRCDSLPSTRNRTPSECSNHSITNSSMPPPRTIPSLNQQSAHRPHSMYNRHSHSPPMNTLSPSTGCSESEGSNLSIDEPDSICQSSTPDESGNFAARYYNSRTTGSSNVIPEENDDYASCCAETNHYHRDKLNNQGNIQSSLNLPIHTTTTPYDDIDNQDHYMALSPCASSPHSESCSHAASSLGNDFHPKYMPMSTGNHSRSSSLAEDGYMQMVSDTGKSSKKNGLLTSNTSTCSVNSRDHRYNEFHAENIDTRFDELHLDMERPTRTYSVGSRPEYNKRRLPVENIICNQQMDQNRVRAFSVGSRAKYPRCDQDLIREVMRPNILSSYNNNNITMEGKGRKSTSAPLLVHKSQSSVERMSDLMEIDFSQNSSDRSGSGSVTDSIASPITSTATTVPSIHNQSVPVTTANLSSSPGNVRSLHNRTVSNPVAVPFTRPRCGTFGSSSSPRKATGYDDVDGINVPGDGYCEMKPGSFNKTTEVGSSGSSSGILSKLSNSPLKISSILTKQPMGNEKINTSDYLTMSPSNSNSLSSSTSSLLRSTSRNDRSSSTNRLATSADNKQVAMETDSFPSTASGTPEGYMEMSFNKNKVVINGGNGTWSSQNRSPSMPIDINPKPKSLTQLNTQTSPCIDRSSFLMEEEESHDQVDSGIVTSLPRQFSNPKQFTFNPASASFSPKDDYNHHKCLVDATSGKIQLLNNTSEKNTPNESKILNTEGNQKLEALSNDYAEMTIGDSSSKFNDYADMSSLIAAKSKNQNQKKPVIENDYVNINPREERLVTSLTAITPPTTNGIVKPAPKTPQPVTTTPKANPLFTRQKSEPRRLPEQSSNQHQDSEYEMMCPSPMFKPIKAEDDGDYDGYVPIEFGNNRKLQVNRTNSSNRPKSVEEFSSSSSAISAASSTSTLCGSNSNSSSSASILTAAAATKSLSPTVNGAFKVQQTQPELHYAKLDLPPCSAYNSSSNLASPAAAVCITPPVGGGPGSCSNSASASPSPISNVTQAPTFMYAKIDFNKCEELQRK